MKALYDKRVAELEVMQVSPYATCLRYLPTVPAYAICRPAYATCLRSRYPMPATAVWYMVLGRCYARSGIDIGYGATSATSRTRKRTSPPPPPPLHTRPPHRSLTPFRSLPPLPLSPLSPRLFPFRYRRSLHFNGSAGHCNAVAARNGSADGEGRVQAGLGLPRSSTLHAGTRTPLPSPPSATLSAHCVLSA